MRSLILRTIARGVLPTATLFALHLLLGGHDAPGGGFIAGLVTASAFVLQGIAFGAPYARLARLSRLALGIGLALAMISGAIAPLLGDPLLTHYHTQGGVIALSTTLLFEIGVYLVVIGVTAALLELFSGEVP